MRAAALLQRIPHPAADTDTDADREHRRSRRRARKRTGGATVEHGAGLHVVGPPVVEPIATHDPAVARVRGAGGPIDNASYTCACGFVFAASVSTTVQCPHCGAGQAW